ncbi:MAG TPA: hypothetical protein VFA53_05295 [Xanthobacteraceae bacterium]|nr:hypothetical protein [Xanthobacteraceae bacterium]
MRFALQHEGPASACGDHCRTWISAVGAITADTPADFAAFARGRQLEGSLLVLDSSGGSVHGAIELGRAVRKLGLLTTVGKTTVLTGNGADKGLATLSPDASCESMCVFLLLAGKQRFVPPEAQVMVHEIWLGDRRDDAAAATYSAEDLVVVQRDIGMLAQYTVEMGGSIDLLEAALRIPPWEPLRKLSDLELHHMGFDTVEKPSDHGAQAAAVPAASRPAKPSVPATARGWNVSEKMGQAILSREHPLTVEGEEIGSFNIALACAAAGDSYDVTYIEERRAPQAKTADTLTQVSIAIGRHSIPLKIVKSELSHTSQQLESVARGNLPASLINGLAQTDNGSLTVVTGSLNAVETMTRIGNSGVAQNLPRLTAACRSATPRPDTRAELQPGQAAAAAGAPPQ